MSIETRSVTVEVFRDGDGKPVCMSPGKFCQFLAYKKFGWARACQLTGLELEYEDFEAKVIRPNSQCPIWTAEELKGENHG